MVHRRILAVALLRSANLIPQDVQKPSNYGQSAYYDFDGGSWTWRRCSGRGTSWLSHDGSGNRFTDCAGRY